MSSHSGHPTQASKIPCTIHPFLQRDDRHDSREILGQWRAWRRDELPHRWSLLAWLGLLVLLRQPVRSAAQFSPAQVSVYFSPGGEATDAVVRELASAKTQVLVQAYSFTSVPIAKALVDAHKRGVKLLVVLHKSNQTDKYSAATFLSNAGIQPLIDAQHAIAHSKVMVIDSATTLTGSFNFTKTAEEKNAENLLILDHSD